MNGNVAVTLATMGCNWAAAVDGDETATLATSDIIWARADDDILFDVDVVQVESREGDSAHWEPISSNSARKRSSEVVSRTATCFPFYV